MWSISIARSCKHYQQAAAGDLAVSQPAYHCPSVAARYRAATIGSTLLA